MAESRIIPEPSTTQMLPEPSTTQMPSEPRIVDLPTPVTDDKPVITASAVAEETIELSEEQAAALEEAVKGTTMFITGRAGTGKTLLLRHIIRALVEKYGEEHVFVTASTGIAASYIDGTTLHFFAGVGIAEEPVSELRKHMSVGARSRWTAAKALIIDEISMLRPDTFDRFEEIARLTRRSQQPFGGIQLIISGDFYQLPPVYRRETVHYCFEAVGWRVPRIINLRTVFRQRDTAFIHLLDEVRRGKLSEETLATLATRINVPIVTDTKIKPTILRSTRQAAEEENMRELNKLPGEGWMSTAVDWAADSRYLKQLDDNCQAPQVLLMRVGAQVLLLKNIDVSKGLCNGSVGRIVEFRNNLPVVEFKNIVRVVPKMKWCIRSGKTALATRTQFPLLLGWALTIHKSQGMSLDYADVELSRLFASGQGYTALSRLRSLEGLRIDVLPDPSSFTVDERVLAFHS